MMPSPRPRSTTVPLHSTRFTTPWTIWPTRSLNSSNWCSRSASRTFCTITCLAVCAAMRPKSIGGSTSTNASPTFFAGSRFCACASVSWLCSSSTASTTVW